MHALKVFRSPATQIILATLPLYSQNATWRSSTANTVCYTSLALNKFSVFNTQ